MLFSYRHQLRVDNCDSFDSTPKKFGFPCLKFCDQLEPVLIIFFLTRVEKLVVLIIFLSTQTVYKNKANLGKKNGLVTFLGPKVDWNRLLSRHLACDSNQKWVNLIFFSTRIKISHDDNFFRDLSCSSVNTKMFFQLEVIFFSTRVKICFWLWLNLKLSSRCPSLVPKDQPNPGWLGRPKIWGPRRQGITSHFFFISYFIGNLYRRRWVTYLASFFLEDRELLYLYYIQFYSLTFMSNDYELV